MDTDVEPLADLSLGPHGLPAGQGPVQVHGGLLDVTNGVYNEVRGRAGAPPSSPTPLVAAGWAGGRGG